MTIKYHLHKNHLPNGAHSYRARVEYMRVVDLEGVLDRMVARSSSITRADMLAVFEDFLLALLQLLLDGMRVVTPFGEFGLTIKGSFESMEDKFHAGRHRIELVLKPGKRLEREFKGQEGGRESTLSDAQALYQPSRPRRGGSPGHRLKFDPADER